MKADRDIDEIRFSKLRRLADALKAGNPFDIHAPQTHAAVLKPGAM